MTGSASMSASAPGQARSRLNPSVIGVVWGALLTLIPFYDYFLRPNYEGSSLYQSVNHVVPAIAVLSTATLLAAVGFSFVAAWIIGVDYKRQTYMAGLSMTLTVLAGLSGMTANAAVMPLVILTLFLAYVMAVNFGALAMGLIKLMRVPTRNALMMVVLAAIAGVLVFIFGSGFIAHKVLLVDDQYRGVASNGSGRLIGWAETLNVISAHPLFGVGLRQHEQYLHAVSSAHNAYLAAAAEQGLIGLAVYLFLMVGAAIRALFKVLEQYTRQRVVLFGYLVFLLVIGLFEQYSYQTGNSFSLIGMVAAALSWRIEPKDPVVVYEPPPVAAARRMQPRGHS